MRPGLVPLVVALLPLAAIHLCYLLAAHFGHVPWCVPYVDSCASISAASRQVPESHVFRAAIMPSAALMFVYWILAREWLRTLGSRTAFLSGMMLALGFMAALGLIVFAAVLGEIGHTYHLQRRVGVTLFYGLTVLAQLLLTIQAEAIFRVRPNSVSVWTSRGLRAISAVTVLLALTHLLLWAFFEDHHRVDDALQWWVTLLVLLHPLVTFFAWNETGFRAPFTVFGRPPPS